MKLIILGSGGSTPIPRPGCNCRVCVEARKKGVPYARSGASLFIPKINLLIDTPEDIASQLNREGIDSIDYILYSHWHPDHTFGMRIVERMYMFWLGRFVKEEMPPKKVKICALEKVMKDLLAIRNKHGSFFSFYEKLGLIETTELKSQEPLKIESFSITPIEVQTGFNEISTVFIIEEGNKKTIYAPCDSKPFPDDKLLENPDLLIVGNVIPPGPLRDKITIPEDNVLRRELFSFDEILELARKLNAKKVIITHIEEEWGRSFDELKEVELKQEDMDIKFAYDGMRIKI
jgi:phosphoribosyl 1,2-cyclic phosphate phosphodiesterase